ncbi:hypothetical protein [Streptosporangium sp. OZ121]|uniref:phage tail tube protein n=1 Tax=Streptosporangium sp. OZ121 TaxID=3444183 RepID=UPI003F7969D0
MSNINADAIRFAPLGRILMGDPNATIPTFPTTSAAFDDETPIVGFTDLGYASEEGVSLTPSLTTNSVSVWQSATAAKLNVTEAGLQFGFTLMQWDKDSTALFFNATWTKDEPDGLSTLILPSNPVLRERSFLVLWGDGDDVSALFVPRAMVSERQALTVGKANPQSLGMTVTSLDSAGELARIATTADMVPAP